MKSIQQYKYLVQDYEYICEVCKTKSPIRFEKCFNCGEIGTIKLDKVKKKIKKPSSIRGGTLTININ